MSEGLELAIRMTKDFWKKNKDFVMKMVKQWGKPVMIELWDKRFFYFSMKYEFNFVDAYSKASALSTDQFDVENAERYGIEYTDKDGKKKNPIILHCSPCGGIERLMYAILEKQYLENMEGKKPILPLWLSPTQVRFVPISEDQTKYCEQLASKFKNIRVDVDDRDLTMQKKIRGAEKEWIPYTCIIGDKEVKSGKLSVRIRTTGKQQEMTINSLQKEISTKIKELPYRELPLPKLLSKRPVFVG
jgi:threonyl-tRNA synthetase